MYTHTVKYFLPDFECFQYIKQSFVITDTFFPMVELTHKTNDISKYTKTFTKKRDNYCKLV